MMRFFLLLMFAGLSLADEHWFVFDQYQFSGFYTPLFTLISSPNNKTSQTEQKNLSFALSSYDRSINILINTGNSNETTKRDQQVVKLNIERADLLYNSFNHLIFIGVRQQTRFETYVNCKLIDSYLLYSSDSVIDDDEDDDDDQISSLKVENLAENVQHYQQHIFGKFGCKQSESRVPTTNKTTTIGKPLIRKMQHVIEKVQRRKQRSR